MSLRTLTVSLLAAALCAACRTAPAKPAEAPAPAAPPVDRSILDAATNPCDDFFQYACGGWLKSTEIPADKARWGRGFDELGERNLAELRRMLDADAAGKGDPHDRYVQKVGDFYAACMDEPGVEKAGLGPVQAELAKLDAVKTPAELVRALAVLQGSGVRAGFGFFSDQDAKDATQVIGTLAQGGLGLPDRDWYFPESRKSPEQRKKAEDVIALYRAYAEKLFGLAGEPAPQAAADAKAVLDLETELAKPQWTRVEMRDPKRIYNRVELAGLEKLAPEVPWQEYLAAAGHPGITAISVTTPKFVQAFGELAAKAPPAQWHAYLKFHLLSSAAAARALPRAFVDASFDFSSHALTGAKELEPRWKHCVKQTDRALGFALGQTYVRELFGAGAKERTRALVTEIERAMGRDIAALGWMDDATRKKALEKLGKIFNKVGYPDAWRNYDKLEVKRGDWLATVMAGARFETNRDLDKIGKPVDRNEWDMTPSTVNAYYNPAMNEMVFPAGILQPPWYRASAPDAVNYGAIGMVVGHELTHGFDDQGRQFDGDGNLKDWWTPSVGAEFDRRAQCVVKQYDAYEVAGGVHLNGKLTLGENLADLGGLKLAFAAFEASRAGKPDAGGKIDGYTPEQAFFVSTAQAWCSKTREPMARMLALTDPHSADRFRVNGPMSNLAAFQQAFQCPAGSKMVRAERCEVW